MRTTHQALKATKSVLARAWKPRKENSSVNTAELAFGARHPELFTTQIVLSDGSSFRVRTTAPRGQVKITKDTRSHVLWNPQTGQQIEDEGGYLSSFQKKFQGFSGSSQISFADDAQRAKEQMGTNAMMAKKRASPAGKK
ncbi:hypothetical protein H4R99_000578 [Coemansia sp. RSA 1722]|nr:hypothetical protein LPJ57_000270 [Coemansia sp. RSA 486]KAJ2238060.1 hypothetical protein IWW45_000400 [Coemansia sp. RSA 485]KAJ2603580.1 hypothetical protein GGF39_000073 [Coemansia sp. RSA 1721]KAJ2606183.1 hypothetical protein H4R99_000578 [Coemansia sp. RSA 1722]KAJ2639694.1 hypothetical protein GGF40_000660 [Coemansia sp. RSA 1286]KAJ2707272.1 hypothetical protein FB645_000949 [Coemansia sp. IMI 203386]